MIRKVKDLLLGDVVYIAHEKHESIEYITQYNFEDAKYSIYFVDGSVLIMNADDLVVVKV